MPPTCRRPAVLRVLVASSMKSCPSVRRPLVGPLGNQIRASGLWRPCAAHPERRAERTGAVRLPGNAQSTPLARSRTSACTVRCPRHSRVAAGEKLAKSTAQPPSGCWPAGEPLELGLDHAGREQGARRAAREGREVQRPHELVVGAAGDVQQPVGRDVRPQRLDELGGLRGRRRRGVEQLRGERQHHRVRVRPEIADRGRGSTRSPAPATGAPATAGSAAATRCAVAATTAVICSDDAGSGADPERRARRAGPARAGRTAARRPDCSRRPASRTARRPAGRGRDDVGEHLHRVQRAAGLAGPRPQVGLQAPAVAAVGVPVAVDRGQHGLGVAVAEEQVEPAPVEHAGRSGQEVRGGGQVDAHPSTLPHRRST